MYYKIECMTISGYEQLSVLTMVIPVRHITTRAALSGVKVSFSRTPDSMVTVSISEHLLEIWQLENCRKSTIGFKYTAF